MVGSTNCQLGGLSIAKEPTVTKDNIVKISQSNREPRKRGYGEGGERSPPETSGQQLLCWTKILI